MQHVDIPPEQNAIQLKIKNARESGQLDLAIEICAAAIKKSPRTAFYRRLLADLLFEKRDIAGAFVALADYLATARYAQRNHFATRYARFRRVLSAAEMAVYAARLDGALAEQKIERDLAIWARTYIKNDLPPSPTSASNPIGAEFLKKLDNDANFDRVAKLGRQLEEQSPAVLSRILDDVVLYRLNRSSTYRIDQFCASIYERWQKYDNALLIVSELLLFKDDPVATRSLFRICRAVRNYARADDLISRRPHLLKSDEFNVLYELIYYFEEKDNFPKVEATLKKIEARFKGNLPVLRTVRNFYIRFGLLDDAKRAEKLILDLSRKLATVGFQNLIDTAESESEAMTSKMEELYSELEHQKQLAAISDLTTGISHELGQPITNIRFTIQFYQKIFKKRIEESQVMQVLDSILEETVRMGGLISRLSPLTSSRSVVERFDIVERIHKRFSSEKARLSAENIAFKIPENKEIIIEGDPVKFDQLVSNLLINAIDAIREKHSNEDRRIIVEASQDLQQVHMSFSDTGIGIPFKNRKTIFDPFFSTKEPGKGEGLGLFIVWNLLKSQGGSISVDSDHRVGAKFNIVMKNSVLSKEPR